MTVSEPAARAPRLALTLADLIEDHVFEHGLKAGDSLPTETELEARYDVSRTVVREAARILEQRGLVDIRSGRGMTVSKVDAGPLVRQYRLLLRANPAAFSQLMDVRSLIENHVAALAATNRSETDLAEMRECLRLVRNNPTDYALALEQDLRFHALVGRACGNPLMGLIVDPINECLRTTYSLPLGYMARLESTIEEHEAIFGAIERSDVEGAQRETARHLLRVREYATELNESA